MIQLLTLILALTGFTSRYDPGVMEATIDARIGWGELTPELVAAHDAYIAVVDCELIGASAWLQINGGSHYQTGDPVNGGEWVHALVTDCAVRDDSDGAKSWMLDNNILCEIDGATATRYGFTHYGLLPVQLVWSPPLLVEGVH